MDIQKEKWDYTAMLVTEDAITQEQCDTLISYNDFSGFRSDCLASSTIDCINWGWQGWLKKAKASAVPKGFVLVDEDVLDEIKDSFLLLQEDIAIHRDFGTEYTAKRDFNEILERVTKLKAMIEAQEAVK